MKGQVWSYDLLIAVVAFMLTLAFLVFFWWSVSAAVGAPRSEQLPEEARSIADVLLSPGNPSNWNDTINASNASTWTTITLIGIGEGFGSPELSQGKAEKMLQMNATNYSLLKEKLRSDFDFYVEMREFFNCSNATSYCTARGITISSPEYDQLEHYVLVSGQNFTLGIPPSSGNARTVAVINRFAVYNNSLVKLKVVAWTNQTWQ